jgi:VanZ family protein
VGVLIGEEASVAQGREDRSLTKTIMAYWLPIAAYVGIIFSLSSMSHLPFPFKFPFRQFDKVLHCGEYAVLAILFARALGSSNRLKSWWVILLLTVFFCGVLGALDEIYQSTVPNRDSDVFDALADTLGGCVGSAVYLVLRRFLSRNKPSASLDESA